MRNLLLSLTLVFICFTGNAQVANSAEEISPLLIGEKIPETKLTTLSGATTTKEIFNQKNTILVVYRGGWCLYCNRQLSGLAEIEKNLVDIGYQIVAVSPDSIENDHKIDSNNNYMIVSDSSTALIQNLGIAFKAPDKYGSKLKKASNGENNGILPTPSVFIVDKQGTILFEYISPNYKNRIDETLLLSVAKILK